MKPLSERDENASVFSSKVSSTDWFVGMKPLSERDENRTQQTSPCLLSPFLVGMKPLSERDENNSLGEASKFHASPCRNEATL